MIKPGYLNALPRRTTLLCCVLLMVSIGANHTLQAQERVIHGDTARAIRLFEAGEIRAAISRLQFIVEKRTDDAHAWYYLGLAYKSEGSYILATGALKRTISLSPSDANANVLLASILVMGSDTKSAGEYAKRAIELGVQNAEVHYVLGEANLDAGNPLLALEEADTALRLDSECVDALLTKARALRGLKRGRESVDALSSFLTACPNADDAELWRDDLARWQAALQLPQQTNYEPKFDFYKPSEVAKRARILNKPPPQYTEKARKIGIVGTVVLQVLLSSTGQVTDIKVIQRLRGGLTTEAVKAARGIQFEPATIDGKPVSQFIRVEYNFNVY